MFAENNFIPTLQLLGQGTKTLLHLLTSEVREILTQKATSSNLFISYPTIDDCKFRLETVHALWSLGVWDPHWRRFCVSHLTSICTDSIHTTNTCLLILCTPRFQSWMPIFNVGLFCSYLGILVRCLSGATNDLIRLVLAKLISGSPSEKLSPLPLSH